MITAALMMLQLSAASGETAPVERALDAMHAADSWSIIRAGAVVDAIKAD